MNTQEVIDAWTKESNFCEPRNDYYFNLSTNESIVTVLAKRDQKFSMEIGRKLPGNATHAKYWIKEGLLFDTIGVHEIKPFAAYCEMIGIEPIFKFTKSQSFVRLVNNTEFNDAIKNHFSI